MRDLGNLLHLILVKVVSWAILAVCGKIKGQVFPSPSLSAHSTLLFPLCGMREEMALRSSLRFISK